MDWIAIASGFGVGAIVGMTGVGGGSLMTPLLLTVFKLSHLKVFVMSKRFGSTQ